MENCIFIHPDNIRQSREELDLKVAVIARPFWFMEEHHCTHVIVETRTGIHTRCYLAEYNGISFLIVYGRFDRIRSTSFDIDYMLTQEVLSFLGITCVVGTFVVGSINQEDPAGSIYSPHDFVGLGGYNQSRNKTTGFRNVDMFNPFCVEIRDYLIQSATVTPFQVHPYGVYACFHGFPRIETEAELHFY